MIVLEVPVTQQHIDKGKQSNSKQCMLSLAVLDQLDMEANVGTSSLDTDVWIDQEKLRWVRLIWDEETGDQVRLFDMNKSLVTPFVARAIGVEYVTA